MKEFKIIVTLSENDLKNLAVTNTKNIDIFEIRLDLLSKNFIQNELSHVLKKIKKPLLFTYRLQEDSSMKTHYSPDVEILQRILKDFNSPKNYIDIDLKQKEFFLQFQENWKYNKIYSLHNFSGSYSYEDMLSQIKQVKDKQGIYKFAVMPKTFEEGMEFLSSISKLSKTYKMIGIWMGEMGSFSRVYGDMFGSSFTYATLTDPKAPGQVAVSLILKARKFLFVPK
ncbi:MAG: type I 3-dehydroquinate dehydratase [Leptospiraceae bacterium]|nr:type I 3-dehydroquinate dehydratase [Leptospiraceae bacterium]